MHMFCKNNDTRNKINFQFNWNQPNNHIYCCYQDSLFYFVGRLNIQYSMDLDKFNMSDHMKRKEDHFDLIDNFL